jgi:hypothetical protein
MDDGLVREAECDSAPAGRDASSWAEIVAALREQAVDLLEAILRHADGVYDHRAGDPRRSSRGPPDPIEAPCGLSDCGSG